ncbi:hypothetical protein CN238_32275 [Sinorhizobium meliloti]|nr:hypothetical protein CN238_32275 [Sinorhizobium meliloti]RVH20958.1 hypothetical protein CN214_31845 [Sinorhizobium meliloti]
MRALAATTASGSSLPSWLSFNPSTGCVRQVLQNWAVMRAGHAA